jgi:hypothetical protein
MLLMHINNIIQRGKAYHSISRNEVRVTVGRMARSSLAPTSRLFARVIKVILQIVKYYLFLVSNTVSQDTKYLTTRRSVNFQDRY